jgi:hypothetical protein
MSQKILVCNQKNKDVRYTTMNQTFNIKKQNLYGDQSASSRTRLLQQTALNKVDLSYGGYPVKNTTEKNSVIDALARVRGGGAVAPAKKGALKN